MCKKRSTPSGCVRRGMNQRPLLQEDQHLKVESQMLDFEIDNLNE